MDALFQARADIALPRFGRREVDRRVETAHVDVLAGPDSTHLVAHGLERRAQHPAHLSFVSEQRQLHAARASTAGLTRRAAARKARSLGPIPEIDSFSGASSSPASSAI